MRILKSEALRIEIETPRIYKESVDLFRIGRNEVDANPDGIAFTGPMFEGLSWAGMFNRDIAHTSSIVNQQGLAAVYANTDTAMGYVWQVTPTNTRENQIWAGQDWVRINLAATALGIATQRLSQALQEYPEMQVSYADIHRCLAPEGGTLQKWALLGYGPQTPSSPRWPLEKKIIR